MSDNPTQGSLLSDDGNPRGDGMVAESPPETRQAKEVRLAGIVAEVRKGHAEGVDETIDWVKDLLLARLQTHQSVPAARALVGLYNEIERSIARRRNRDPSPIAFDDEPKPNSPKDVGFKETER